jgi:hypothetical protein
MKKNERLLQEAFFKKQSYADKLKKKLPQYEPQDVKISGQPGFGSILDKRSGALGQQLAVTDTAEAKKRLIGAFGASVGVNTVKNIASRSIKSFPIVISDHIDAETSVMLKRLMEEQYAEYINLMVSNQVIDISQFKSGEEGNIAIQALDVLSGADFGKQAMAKKAMRGELSPDDLFGNFSSFNLIRNEGKEYKTGVAIFDALLEDAVVLPKEESEKLIEFVELFPEEILSLNEASERDKGRTPSERDPERFVSFTDFLVSSKVTSEKAAFDTLRGYSVIKGKMSQDQQRRFDKIEDEIRDYQKELDKLNGITNPTQRDTDRRDAIKNEILPELKSQRDSINREVKDGRDEFTRLTSTDIVVDKDQLKRSLDSSVGELLLNPQNDAIKDRFEKATFLLQSQRISGKEYIEYLVQRLVLPVSKETRIKLVQEFPASQVIDPENTSKNISKADIKRIETNQIMVGKILDPMLKFSAKSVLIATAAGTGAGLGTYAIMGGSIGGGVGGAGLLASIMALLSGPVGPLIIGSAVGGAVLATAIKKRRDIVRTRQTKKIQGWERVEALIAALEEQQRDLKRTYDSVYKTEPSYSQELSPQLLAMNQELSGKELAAELEKYSRGISSLLKSAKVDERKQYDKQSLTDSVLIADFSQNTLSEFAELGNEVLEQLNESYDYKVSLAEAKIQTTIPVQLTKKYEYDKQAKPEVLVAPMFSSRSAMAYGSVEYDKRELKDRKYNAPLIMKITFKERFADGTFADNELVAVIGILGVITRVPSEEMKYILASSAEGMTIKNILKSEGNSANLVSDILGLTKLKKDIESLPQSADVWENLERVARLAVSNKLSGKASGNIANAHLVFSQKEVDEVRTETGKDYLKDKRLSADLMKRYSAFTLMVANDISERLFIYDDPDSISWSVVPYSALRSKDTGDQLTSALMKIGRM